MIRFFSEQYHFLSNFYKVPMMINGGFYLTVEHYYQAMKSLDAEEQNRIKDAPTASIAKHLGRAIVLRNDWEDVKEDFMLQGLREKFRQHYNLAIKLLDTENKTLVEGNNWHDRYWGICYCEKCKGKGLNRLGVLLMKVRSELPRWRLFS